MGKHTFTFSLIFVINLLAISLFGQSKLLNPSFEGEPQDATVPVAWHPCALGTTPDILPGVWGVYSEPSEGDTFVGLITREDGSYESIGQRLISPLKKNECYQFSVDLAHSKTYSGYNKPIKLRIWGGNTKCEKRQLILETDFVNHSAWKTYKIKFSTEEELRYLIFEAHYKDGSFSRRGNILIDNVTNIKKCPRV
ncbi:MAG: hypothetical protein DWQ02_15465 [Bacteroidetes bacterium]|nr:MAG: hypothetical protein DWQ02_15465 [Bacteroidota bacterium]